MNKFDGVANTLFVPLVARINISKKFPEYFMDEKALELEKYLPQGADKGSSEYSNMASVARYYNMDKTVTAFAKSYAESNIVYLGAGLETAYDRLSDKIENRTVHWYEADLPEVIEARKKVFGQRKNETLIAGDMFKLEWVKEIDNSLPTLLIVSGVFQYFHEEEIIAFIKGVERACVITDALACAASESNVAFDPRVIIEDGVCKLADRSALAGSVATMDRLIRTLVQKAEIPLEDAVRMASETPSRIMGVYDRKGSLLI